MRTDGAVGMPVDVATQLAPNEVARPAAHSGVAAAAGGATAHDVPRSPHATAQLSPRSETAQSRPAPPQPASADAQARA